MNTYSLQRRSFKPLSEGSPTYPNRVTLTLLLEPAAAFGMPVPGLIKVAIKDESKKDGTADSILIDTNTARTGIATPSALRPVDVNIKGNTWTASLQGNWLIYAGECSDAMGVDNLLFNLYLTVPAYLALAMPDATYVTRAEGMIGSFRFRWEQQHIDNVLDLVSQEEFENRIGATLMRVPLLGGQPIARFNAAVAYFHTACRLIARGSSPWEFMAEAILNFHKVLVVLFGGDRDAIRKALKSLGYSHDTVESDFIVLDFLRNQFDVGHPSLGLLYDHQLDVLYRYLERAARLIQELLNRVLAKLESNPAFIARTNWGPLGTDRQRTLDKIVANLKPRVEQPLSRPSGRETLEVRIRPSPREPNNP
jgi:hypothetical protein